MAAALSFLKSHGAYVGAAGFLLLAGFYALQGDMTNASHELMMALSTAGLKAVAAAILDNVK